MNQKTKQITLEILVNNVYIFLFFHLYIPWSQYPMEYNRGTGNQNIYQSIYHQIFFSIPLSIIIFYLIILTFVLQFYFALLVFPKPFTSLSLSIIIHTLFQLR